MGNKSVVANANVTAHSVRTTIPRSISKELNLAAGDVLDWSIETRKGKKFIIVRKLQ